MFQTTNQLLIFVSNHILWGYIISTTPKSHRIYMCHGQDMVIWGMVIQPSPGEMGILTV